MSDHTDIAEEIGIQDEQTLAAFLQQYAPPTLFTQYFRQPFEFLRERLADHLTERAPGAALTRMTITGTPVPRGDGHPDYDEPGPDPENPRIVLTRVALYVPFTARVTSPAHGDQIVHGALTSVLGNLNQPGNQVLRTWMDIDADADGRLVIPDNDQYQERMLSVGQWLPGDYPPGSAEREGLTEG